MKVDELIERIETSTGNKSKNTSGKEPSIMTFGNTKAGFNVENGMLSILSSATR